MAGYGTMQQRTNGISSATQPNDAANPRLPEFHLVCPLSIPSSSEAAALRISRNLGHYTLLYLHFVWIILFIALIPARKVSLIYLVIMTYVASLYLLILRTFPGSYFLNKLIDKRLVLCLVVVATMVELIFTGSALHLLITLAATTPLVLIHAALWTRQDLIAAEKEVSDELLPIVQESTPRE